MKLTSAPAVCVALAAFLALLPACEKKPPTSPTPSSGTSAPKPAAPAGEHKDTAAGHGGAVIQLGTSTIGSFDVKATRDEGQIVAGKDAPIDVTVTPAAGATVKAIGVRFWIGTEDGKGSAKAKADIENPAEPNRWHTHAEIPNPMPAGSRLWVEIEDDKGGKSVGGFDLKS
ncbi:MAG: hypothetical protein AMXMBFR58_27670 [Phycisphaerae bacterium]